MGTNANPGLQFMLEHFRCATMLTLVWAAISTSIILANPTKSGNQQAINGTDQLQTLSKMAVKVAARLPADVLNPEKSPPETPFPASYSSFNYDWLNFGYFNYLLNMTSGGAAHPQAIQRPKRRVRVPYQSVGFVRWTRNTMMANVPEPMKRLIFPRCPFFPCPDNHECDLATNSCRLLLYPDYE